MAKVSALAILALIIGIGGIAVGGYSLFSVVTDSGVHRSYYATRELIYTSPSEDSWFNIPDISISFQVDAGESVYFSFTCYARLEPVSSVTTMHFRLKIDGYSIASSLTTVGPTSGTALNTYFSVAFQQVNTTLSAGIHIVVVETERECDGFIDNCLLFVQTYT